MHGRLSAISGREQPASQDGSGKITSGLLMSLLESQQFRCALTNRELTPETASLDHKQPLSRGGSNDMSNAQIVHYDVNMAKRTMTTEEFVSLCREVVAVADGN